MQCIGNYVDPGQHCNSATAVIFSDRPKWFRLTKFHPLLGNILILQHFASHSARGGSMEAGGPRPPVKFLSPPVAPKKVQDKAVVVACQNFQKACSALVVILMLSRFVTF